MPVIVVDKNTKKMACIQPSHEQHSVTNIHIAKKHTIIAKMSNTSRTTDTIELLVRM